jgi:hypothetical protein
MKDARNREIASRYEAGEPGKIIGNDYAISVSRVYKIAKQWRGRAPHLTPAVLRPEWSYPDAPLLELCRQTRVDMQRADPDAIHNRINDEGDYVR